MKYLKFIESFVKKSRDVTFKDILSIFGFLIALPISYIFKIKHPNLWLICEDENEARDNGYWFFKYVREKHPEQDVAYAINFNSPDYKRVCDLGKTIQYGSLKHWVYYLTANKNISSQKGGKPNAAICYVLEVLTGLLNNNRIFLQHGIIINDLKWLYYPVSKFSMFICSVKPEYEYVKNNFGYPKDTIYYLGLPRHDQLHNLNINKKQILVMPTWRNWLVMKRTNENGIIQDFVETDYYKKWNSFLNNNNLLLFLKSNNLKLIFYPHRNLQKFIEYFYTESENIIIASSNGFDVQQLLKDSALLITDYSSVFMDFVYMKKPVVFYQFDLEKFRTTQYQKGYFDYENNPFGNSYREEETVIEEIKKIYKNGYFVSKDFLEEHSRFFELYDTNNCLRIYNKLLKQ